MAGLERSMKEPRGKHAARTKASAQRTTAAPTTNCQANTINTIKIGATNSAKGSDKANRTLKKTARTPASFAHSQQPKKTKTKKNAA